MRIEQEVFDRLRGALEPDGARMPLEQRLSALTAPLREERRQLDDLREAALELTRTISAEIKKIDRVLRVVGGEEKPREKRPLVKQVSAERMEQAREIVAAAPDQEWTSTRLEEATGWSRASAGTALAQLREEEYVRQVRIEQGGRRVYRLMETGDGNEG
jgi:response regulator of citrate/malate metabolism